MQELTPAESFDEVRKLNDRVSALEHRYGNVSEAFPKNDLEKPDYDGHRKAHNTMIEEAKVIDGYKNETAKQVIGYVVTVILTLIGVGVLTTMGKT